MAPDPFRDAYLQLVEARQDIDGRYLAPKRIGVAGGNGHFSLVFSAVDNHTNGNVAIKVFRPDRLSDNYRYQCFRREAELLERLAGTHNVLGWVAGHGEFVERVTSTTGIPLEVRFPYYAVELAVRDVGEIVRNGTWTTEEKLLGFRQMCKSIQRIHKRRVVHRDVKPSNFMVMSDGSLKLSDFGTARDLAGNDPALLANYLLAPGDNRYASPEMLALLHDDDPSIAIYGDVYALGATLFELLTATMLGVQIFSPSFAADLARTMGAVRSRDRQRIYLQFVQNLAAGHPLPPLSGFGNLIPAAVRTLLDNLYQSMAALDYRRRLCDFERIFLRINQCLLVLRNEEKIRHWNEQKAERRHRRDAKCVAARSRAAN